MEEYSGYRAISRVYDRLNAEIDYRAWADFVESCFKKFLKQPPKIVLDLACGTGSMTKELARRGYDMIGIDGSADMLSVAFSESADLPGILYLQQDMRSFELYGTVGAVTCCLDSVNYLLNDEDLFACFSLVHNYLDPDGLFLFDVNSPYKFREIYGNNAYVLENEISSRAVYCGWQNEFSPESGICNFYLSLFEEQEDGSYLRSDEEQKERLLSLEKLQDVLQKCGFEFLGVWSDLNFAPVGEKSERFYLAARAIKN